MHSPLFYISSTISISDSVPGPYCSRVFSIYLFWDVAFDFFAYRYHPAIWFSHWYLFPISFTCVLVGNVLTLPLRSCSFFSFIFVVHVLNSTGFSFTATTFYTTAAALLRTTVVLPLRFTVSLPERWCTHIPHAPAHQTRTTLRFVTFSFCGCTLPRFTVSLPVPAPYTYRRVRLPPLEPTVLPATTYRFCRSTYRSALFCRYVTIPLWYLRSRLRFCRNTVAFWVWACTSVRYRFTVPLPNSIDFFPFHLPTPTIPFTCHSAFWNCSVPTGYDAVFHLLFSLFDTFYILLPTVTITVTTYHSFLLPFCCCDFHLFIPLGDYHFYHTPHFRSDTGAFTIPVSPLPFIHIRYISIPLIVISMHSPTYHHCGSIFYIWLYFRWCLLPVLLFYVGFVTVLFLHSSTEHISYLRYHHLLPVPILLFLFTVYLFYRHSSNFVQFHSYPFTTILHSSISVPTIPLPLMILHSPFLFRPHLRPLPTRCSVLPFTFRPTLFAVVTCSPAIPTCDAHCTIYSILFVYDSPPPLHISAFLRPTISVPLGHRCLSWDSTVLHILPTTDRPAFLRCSDTVCCSGAFLRSTVVPTPTFSCLLMSGLFTTWFISLFRYYVPPFPTTNPLLVLIFWNDFTILPPPRLRLHYSTFVRFPFCFRHSVPLPLGVVPFHSILGWSMLPTIPVVLPFDDSRSLILFCWLFHLFLPFEYHFLLPSWPTTIGGHSFLVPTTNSAFTIPFILTLDSTWSPFPTGTTMGHSTVTSTFGDLIVDFHFYCSTFLWWFHSILRYLPHDLHSMTFRYNFHYSFLFVHFTTTTVRPNLPRCVPTSCISFITFWNFCILDTHSPRYITTTIPTPFLRYIPTIFGYTIHTPFCCSSFLPHIFTDITWLLFLYIPPHTTYISYHSTAHTSRNICSYTATFWFRA